MKLISPTLLAIALITLFACGTAAFSQDSTLPKQYSAPVNWTEYQISSQKLSIRFPKLPVLTETLYACSEIKVATYHAYADGVVYEFEWHAKSSEPLPSSCSTKTTFTKAAFTARLEAIKAQNLGYVESDGTIAGLPAKVLRSNAFVYAVSKTRWLLWLEDRWLELGVTRLEGTKVDEASFTGGLKLSSKTGQEIGAGSEATYGDADVDLKSDFVRTNTGRLVLVIKPRPGYTDAARQANVQGTVILRVTFFRNGSVDSVSVLKALPLGLTEQAISAARKIAFLPATVDKKAINITKQIEYTFSIY